MSENENLYEYNLKGIVNHTGTADFGHYFSYINVKDDTWLEFNDAVIKDFDPKNIESQCFGMGEKFFLLKFYFLNIFSGKGFSTVSAYILSFIKKNIFF